MEIPIEPIFKMLFFIINMRNNLEDKDWLLDNICCVSCDILISTYSIKRLTEFHDLIYGYTPERFSKRDIATSLTKGKALKGEKYVREKYKYASRSN